MTGQVSEAVRFLQHSHDAHGSPSQAAALGTLPELPQQLAVPERCQPGDDTAGWDQRLVCVVSRNLGLQKTPPRAPKGCRHLRRRPFGARAPSIFAPSGPAREAA